MITTLKAMTAELEVVEGKDEERALALKIDIGRLKDALLSNIEATLVKLFIRARYKGREKTNP